MKNLLIILSFLLLSSPVIGNNHKGETLYLWKTSSGVQWFRFGDKYTHPQYKGEVENGKPNGLGVLIYPFSIHILSYDVSVFVVKCSIPHSPSFF